MFIFSPSLDFTGELKAIFVASAAAMQLKFYIQREFLENPSLLWKRLKDVGVVSFILSPLLVNFMLVYLFLIHAKQFYHHPSIASSQRWSNLSKWIFRKFNEICGRNLYFSVFQG